MFIKAQTKFFSSKDGDVSNINTYKNSNDSDAKTKKLYNDSNSFLSKFYPLRRRMINAPPTTISPNKPNTDTTQTGLKQIVNKIKTLYNKKSIKLNNNCMINRHLVETAMNELTTEKGISLKMPMKTTGENGEIDIDASVTEWLSFFELPKPVFDNLKEMITNYDFDLTNKSDKLWFEKIVWDRVTSVSLYNICQEQYARVNTVVKECIERFDDFYDFLAKQALIDNLKILFDRHMLNFNDDRKEGEWYSLFEQDSKTFTEKWTQYQSESKKICQSLLNQDNEPHGQWTWKCYQCTTMNCNDNNSNRCTECGQGINPLWIPKQNNSEIFCVSKPFGLIEWKPDVC